MENVRKEGEEKSRKKQIAIIEKCIEQFPSLSNLEVAQIAQVEEKTVKQIRDNMKNQ